MQRLSKTSQTTKSSLQSNLLYNDEKIRQRNLIAYCTNEIDDELNPYPTKYENIKIQAINQSQFYFIINSKVYFLEKGDLKKSGNIYAKFFLPVNFDFTTFVLASNNNKLYKFTIDDFLTTPLNYSIKQFPFSSGQETNISLAKISPFQRYLFMCSPGNYTQNIICIDFVERNQSHLDLRMSKVQDIQFSEDELLVVFMGDHEIIIYDMIAGEQQKINIPSTSGIIKKVAFMESRQNIVILTSTGDLFQFKNLQIYHEYVSIYKAIREYFFGIKRLNFTKVNHKYLLLEEINSEDSVHCIIIKIHNQDFLYDIVKQENQILRILVLNSQGIFSFQITSEQTLKYKIKLINYKNEVYNYLNSNINPQLPIVDAEATIIHRTEEELKVKLYRIHKNGPSNAVLTEQILFV